jgi:hypothetical protein
VAIIGETPRGMTLVSLQLGLENKKKDAAKITEINEENSNLNMIPSIKGDRCRHFSNFYWREKLSHRNGGEDRG